MNNVSVLLGRVGLSLIFILSGWGKIFAYAGTQQYLQSAGLPGALLPLVIAVEFGGGLAILFGFATRWVSVALAGFSILAAVFFHSNFGDQNQFIHFMKNVAVAGGFLALFANGAGPFSIDALLNSRKTAR
jgi:putative oxidoreductase